MIENQIASAWIGHFPFAYWLVQTLNPKVTVELGVDYGASLIALARYNKGHTYGIDWFQGDPQAGSRDTEASARRNIEQAGLSDRVTIIKESFDDAAAKWTQPIDLIHVDGYHIFDVIKNDFDKWTPHLRSGGVLLFHDTESFPTEVGRFFDGLDWPKFKFTHSAGLGVATKP